MSAKRVACSVKRLIWIVALMAAGCVSRTNQPSLFGGMMGGGLTGGAPLVMPYGGNYSIYGGGAYAGTGFDPRAANAIAIVDQQREAARLASIPRVEYVPATTTETPSPTPQREGEIVTRAALRPIIGELTNQNRRIRAVERRR